MIRISTDLIYDFYIISTPIGNCKDITLRALETLTIVDAIICEDTRVTNKLLHFHQIKNTLLKYNDLSTENDRKNIIKRLKDGQKLALVSDAGTPLIADPGYKLVREIYQEGYKIDVLPGACAAISALVLSGMPSDSFYFLGFLPNTNIKRSNKLISIKAIETSFILYESPHRIIACLNDIYKIFGDIEVAVIREISKIYQESIIDKINIVLDILLKRQILKGEYVIIFHNKKNHFRQDVEDQNTRINNLYNNLEQKFSMKEASEIIAQQLAISRKLVYNQLIKLKGN